MSGLERTQRAPGRRRLARMEVDERQRRAISRALARGGAKRVEPGVYPDTYRVRSGTREECWHNVAVDGGVYRCDCEAGLARLPCAHAAAVYVARLEASGARVTGPGNGTPLAPAVPTPPVPTASDRPDLQPVVVRHPRRQVDLL